jgi:hypothetical protein
VLCLVFSQIKEISTILNNHIANLLIYQNELRIDLEPLKEEFKDLIFSPEENYILVRNNSMKINGSDYYGKYFNAEGVPVFFIKGLYGAQKFFQYQKAKQLINSSLDDVLEADKDLSDGIRMIRKYYKMNSNQAVLLDYLDNK